MESHLLDLADEISTCTQRITHQLRKRGLREPHYGVDSPRELWMPPELDLKETKAKLVAAATSLQTLVMGPMAFHRNWFGSHYDLAAIHILLEFHVLEHIPVNGTIDVDTLAKAVGLDADKLCRLLRLVATQRYVDEPHLRVFQHTVLSETIVKDELLRAQGGMQLGEMYKAGVVAADYLRAKPFCRESNDSPFSFKWGASLYEYYNSHLAEGARFAKAMEGIQRFDRPAILLTQWIKTTNKSYGKLVDVGGGSGHVALDLAKQFPSWHFVVQDLHQVMFTKSAGDLPASILERVTYEYHDFFASQPLREDCDGWVLRQCLHNWSDQDSVRVIRGFLPAMEANPNAALLINETVIPKRGSISLHDERQMRQIDIAMFIATNAKQRSERDWKNLVNEADPRLRITSILKDEGTMALLDVRLDNKQSHMASSSSATRSTINAMESSLPATTTVNDMNNHQPTPPSTINDIAGSPSATTPSASDSSTTPSAITSMALAS